MTGIAWPLLVTGSKSFIVHTSAPKLDCWTDNMLFMVFFWHYKYIGTSCKCVLDAFSPCILYTWAKKQKQKKNHARTEKTALVDIWRKCHPYRGELTYCSETHFVCNSLNYFMMWHLLKVCQAELQFHL